MGTGLLDTSSARGGKPLSMLSPHCLLWLSISEWAEREGARSEDRAPNRLEVGICLGQAVEATTVYGKYPSTPSGR